MTPPLEIELGTSPPIREIVLTSPTLTSDDILELGRAVRSRPTTTAAMVLRSEGPDFCRGREPGPPPADRPAVRDAVVGPIVELYEAIATAPYPVLAAVRGQALGLGFALAATCDVVVATPDAEFALPEIHAGFAPLLALGQLAPVVPRHVLFRLAGTGGPLDGRRLWGLGVVSDLADDEALDGRVREIAVALGGAGPIGEVKTFLARRGADARRADLEFAADRLVTMLAAR